jgi:hypothetical protein
MHFGQWIGGRDVSRRVVCWWLNYRSKSAIPAPSSHKNGRLVLIEWVGMRLPRMHRWGCADNGNGQASFHIRRDVWLIAAFAI